MKIPGVKGKVHDGYVVMNLTALSEDALDDILCGDALPGDTSADLLDPEAFVHLSMVYEQPRRPTFRSSTLD